MLTENLKSKHVQRLDFPRRLDELQMDRAPYLRAKDFDHDDVETEFHSDRMLSFLANLLASVGVFCVFMIFIAMAMQVPDGALAWLILTVWGL